MEAFATLWTAIVTLPLMSVVQSAARRQRQNLPEVFEI